MLRIFILFFLLVFFNRYGYCQLTEQDFRAMIQSHPGSSNIRLNGYYNNITAYATEIGEAKKEEYDSYPIVAAYNAPADSVIISPVFFFNNGVMLIDFFKATIDEYKQQLNLSKDEFYSEKNLRGPYWGTYQVNGDTITALVFQTYLHRLLRIPVRKIVKYQGLIKNQDTILDWKIIKPFPKLFDSTNQLDLTWSTLTFHQLDFKKTIDSNKAWINKYRN